MNENINNEFEEIFQTLSGIVKELNNSVVAECINFNDEWKFKFVQNLRRMKEDSRREFENLESRIMTDEMKCIFIGETSAGKSTLINATLGRQELPRGAGSVTNSLVEIKRSQNNESFIRINETEMDIGSIRNLIHYRGSAALPAGSKVDLFYTQKDCPFLQDDMVFIDIPGIDADEEIDKKTLSYCRKADLIVLVVNATNTISNRMRDFVKQNKTEFSNLNFILVYNYWDQIDNEEDPERIKIQLQDISDTFFTEVLNKPSNYGEARTFYLSAKEELTNKNGSEDNNNQRNRKEEFRRFRDSLTREMRINTLMRRVGYLNELFDVVTKIIEECRRVVDQIVNTIPTAANNFTNKLNQENNLESEINERISRILEPLYKKIYDTVSREIGRSTDQKIEIKRIENAEKDILKKGLTDLKSVVKNIIARNNDEDRMIIIEKMYFPHYLEKNYPINENFDTNINSIILSIFNIVQQIGEGTANFSSADLTGIYSFLKNTGVTGIYILAKTGVIGINILKDLLKNRSGKEIAIIAAPIIIPAVTYSLGKVTAVCSDFIIQREIWSANEKVLKEIWDKILQATRESYSKFIREIGEKLSNLFDVNGKRDKLTLFENQMDELRRRIDALGNAN